MDETEYRRRIGEVKTWILSISEKQNPDSSRLLIVAGILNAIENGSPCRNGATLIGSLLANLSPEETPRQLLYEMGNLLPTIELFSSSKSSGFQRASKS